jgi:competence protein ComEA
MRTRASGPTVAGMRTWLADEDDEPTDEEVRRRFVRLMGAPTSGGSALDATLDDGHEADPVRRDSRVVTAAQHDARVVTAAQHDARVVTAAQRNARAVTAADYDAHPADAAGHDGRAAEAEPVDGEHAARRALAAFDPGRRAVRALAVVVLVVGALAGLLAWRSRPHAEPIAVAPPAVSTTSPSTAGILVAVAGRVNRPGLVRLPAGARVADAIEAAGGVQPGTDLAYLNLARKLIDGELLLVGVSPPPGTEQAGPATHGDGPGTGPVNLNTATVAELDRLPGVGPVLAQRIVDHRTRHGGFRSVDELRMVDGVGEARYAQLKDLITV